METGNFEIESPAFKYGEAIPKKFTAEGKNISPPLTWDHIPVGAQSLALICEDPDAPTNPPFVHWVVYNIPPQTNQLKSNATSKKFPVDFLSGQNSAGRVGYFGPKPPAGTGPHRYYFKLFALDQRLVLSEGATKENVLDAMRDHILGEVEVMGKYEIH